MNTIKVENNRISSTFDLNIKDKDIFLEDQDICIIYKNTTNNYNFIISNTVKIFEYYNNTNINNKYEILKDSDLIMNRFSFDCSLVTNIKLNENSKLVYKYSCLNFTDNTYLINIDHDKNTTSKIISN